ncbi:uncharacterized protein P7C70_g1198, partial [Phenoliferia sp. Uapishka_3]
MSLPFPGERYEDDNQEQLRPRTSTSSDFDSNARNLQPRHQSSSAPFISTTTQPLPEEQNQQPRSASPAASSILNRGRPKSRASSFFGADTEDNNQPQNSNQQPRSSSEWGRQDREGANSEWTRGDAESDYGGGAGARSRAGSFFGVASASPGADGAFAFPGSSSAQVEAGPSSGVRGVVGSEQDPSGDQRRSSFYGLDAHLPSTPPAEERSSYQLSSSANYANRTMQQQQNGGDSGSGSQASHDAPRGAAAGANAKYHNAPYAASRAASLYGMPTSVDGSSGLPPAAPLLDQSHLQPGALASLLSHDKTLELYRTNAKKTNDPDVQFEFCTFVMEVVGEMEENQALAMATSGGDGQQDPVMKQKQQALVAESVALLSKLAHRGHVKSQYFLADCYTQGIGTAKGKRDYDKAFPLFVLAGKHGHADACFRAAQCCENAWGCKRDQTKAVTLLRRAAVLSHPGAMHRLGLAEINGELGLSKRPREGVKWLKRASELADAVDPPQPQSLHELAMLSERGIDNVIFKDEEYAAELLARASELQYAPSAYKLGECYEYGKMGCPQDAALSIHYYNIAAQQNHREACFALTAWYLVGSPGVLPQSDTEAYLWARKAADMGLAKAEYAVGYFTEVGIGTYKDDREALEWFKKAAAQGDKRATERLRNATTSAQKAFARERDLPSASPPPPPHASYKPPQSITKRMQKKQRDAPNRPASVGTKDKSRTASAGHPQMPPPPQRQRSHSQPHPVDPALSAQSGAPYGQYPVGGPNQNGQYGGGGESFRPLQPGEVKMPLRQQRGASPPPNDEAAQGGEREAQREKLQKKRGGGGAEDKDCIVS